MVSNAMELRGFGKNKKRTWYMGKKLVRNDYLTIGFAVVFMAIALTITLRMAAVSESIPVKKRGAVGHGYRVLKKNPGQRANWMLRSGKMESGDAADFFIGCGKGNV